MRNSRDYRTSINNLLNNLKQSKKKRKIYKLILRGKSSMRTTETKR